MTIMHDLAINRGKFHDFDVASGKYENPKDVLLIRAQHDFEALAAYLDIVQHHLNEFNSTGDLWTIDDEDVVTFRAEIEKTLNMARNYIAAEL